MHLLVDLQGMQNGSRLRGIGRYVGSLTAALQHLAAASDSLKLTLLVSELFPDHIEELIAALGADGRAVSLVRFNGVGPVAELDRDNAWRRHASELLYQDFVARISPDVLLLGSVMEGATDNSIASFPPRSKRSYATFSILYDLIPLLSPEEHLRSDAQKQWYNRRLKQLTASDGLLAISESARREAIDYAGMPADKVFTIGAAAGEFFSSVEVDGSADALHLSVCRYFGITRPYLLLASAFDGRKNFDGLIRAYARLPQPIKSEHQLVLVCKLADHQRRDLEELVRRCNLEPGEDVILTGFVPDDDLHLLYRGCKLFVFPSFHEGFGLPALEAMWCGAPTIGSSASSVPEVIGLEEALFDPSDTPGMANLMERALVDQQFRERLTHHARTQCRKFNWAAVAERAVAAMESHAGLSAPVASEDELVERIARGGPGQPSLADLAEAAKAIPANRLAAENDRLIHANKGSFGVSMQSVLR